MKNRKIYLKNYYLKNKQKLLKQRKNRYNKNKQRELKRNKKYNLEHKEKIKKYLIEWYLKNKERLLVQHAEYRKNHKDEIKEQQKIYRQTYKKEIKKYINNRLKTNINFKIIFYLRRRLNLALKGNPKSSTTMKLVGCSIKKLKKHLEKNFKAEMSWSNYGKWHVDHIIPCASFDLSKPEEQKKCFNYTNLQPLWALDNLKKGKSLIKK